MENSTGIHWYRMSWETMFSCLNVESKCHSCGWTGEEDVVEQFVRTHPFTHGLDSWLKNQEQMGTFENSKHDLSYTRSQGDDGG